MRGFGELGTGEQAVGWFKERLKIYPLATGPKKNSAVNAGGMGINSLPPEDGSAFEMLNAIIQYEPTELFNSEQLGRLATLGCRERQTVQAGCPDEENLRSGCETGSRNVPSSSSTLPGIQRSISGPTDIGKRCLYAIRNSLRMASATLMPVLSGTTRPLSSPPTSTQPNRA